jgi:short-subunit dehydrogenase
METQEGQGPFAVITGASRGIGAAYARAFARKGYDLLLVARDQARLDQVLAELSRSYPISAQRLILDLAEPEASNRLHAEASRWRAVPDVLIHNAGFGLFGEFASMPMARIQTMLRLHVNTVVESIRLFLPGMIGRRSGAIITVSSVAGFYAVPYLAEYAATKAFLISFSEALAEEVRGAGVRVQVCCPGTADTDFHATAGYQPKSPLRGQTAAEVVAESLAALDVGRVVVTTGVANRLLVGLTRLVPRSWRARGAGRWMRDEAGE